MIDNQLQLISGKRQNHMISPQKDFDSGNGDSEEQEEQKMTRVISRTPSQ